MTSWIIKTYHKKSIQEHEYWSNNEMDIIKKTLWRGGSWKVVTSDNNIPNWTFTTIPGGDDKKDSVDIYSYPGNFDDVELIEVVLGPSSALYGPNAHSGVLNIVTSSSLATFSKYSATPLSAESTFASYSFSP